MSIRRQIIEYSRGNSLRWFWRFYRWQKASKHLLFRDVFTFFMSRSAHRHGGYVGPDTVFQDIPSLPHGLHGIFISRYAVIGKGCWIYQNVTIGEVNGKAPVIGDGCFIGAGAIIVPGTTIGDNSVIGAGSVVTHDIPSDVVAVGNPCRILRKIGENDRICFYKDERIDWEELQSFMER